MAKIGCAGSAIDVAPICLNFGITAPVLSCVITWRGRIEIKSPLRTTAPGVSPSAWRAAIFSTSVRPIQSWKQTIQFRGVRPALLQDLLFRGAFTQEFGDIEVHEIGVMKNDRFD